MPPRTKGKSKKERLTEQIAAAVGAGREIAVETVDFSDPNRPKTCLEVDFPIIPINQIAAIEGNAGKPIYQMSKWWARRRSSVFRSMLLAAAMKAPDDEKGKWFKKLGHKKAQESTKKKTSEQLNLSGVAGEGDAASPEAAGNANPPFVNFCASSWQNFDWEELPASFDIFSVPWQERRNYRYEGPEIIYSFWAKHGPCQREGCGHRTPIMSSPVVAIKTLTVDSWMWECLGCKKSFDVERHAARMSPDSPLFVAPDEKPFAVMDDQGRYLCPHCGKTRTDAKALARSARDVAGTSDLPGDEGEILHRWSWGNCSKEIHVRLCRGRFTERCS